MKSFAGYSRHASSHRAIGLTIAILLAAATALTVAPTTTVAAGSDWTQFRNGPTHEANDTTEATLSAANAADLGISWTAFSNGGFSSPAIVNGVVYVGGWNGKLYAFAVGCGTGGAPCTPLWTATTGNSMASSPAVANGVVYTASYDGKLYAFDEAGVTGCGGSPKVCAPLWTANVGIGTGSFTSPAVVGGVLYIGGGDGNLYAFDAAGVTGCSGSPKVCTPCGGAMSADTSIPHRPSQTERSSSAERTARSTPLR